MHKLILRTTWGHHLCSYVQAKLWKPSLPQR